MASDQIKIEHFAANFKNSHNRSLLDVEMSKVSGGPQNFLAFVYQCHLVEDNDGAPRCYGWDNPTNVFQEESIYVQKGLQPYDRLGNATSPYENWDAGSQDWYWAGLYAATKAFAEANNLTIDTRARLRSGRPDKVVAGDPQSGLANKYPVIQGSQDPAPGYYVSTTGQVFDASFDQWEQNRYWNAAASPYCVWATEWQNRATGVDLGDFGLAIRNSTGTSSEFAFRDTGTNYNVGESSRKLCRTLVPTPDGQAVYNEDYVSFMVFPHLHNGGGGIRTQISKLAAADNSDELVLFLASGASLSDYKVLLRRLYKPDYHNVRLPTEFSTLMMALSSWGYPTDGKLHLPETSINL